MNFLTGTALATILFAGAAFASEPNPFAAPTAAVKPAEVALLPVADAPAPLATPIADAPPKQGDAPTPPRAPSSTSSVTVTTETPEDGTVRMVIDRIHEDDQSRKVCVWVPSGDDTGGGALSCDGEDVRVFSFGDEDGDQVIIDGEVVDGNAIRRIIRTQIGAVAEAMSGLGNFEFEWVDSFHDDEDFAEEMEELAREMEELHLEMRGGYHERHEMSEEERAEFEEEMREFEQEMAELSREMAELNAEMRLEFVEEMAEARADQMEELAEEMEELRRHEFTVRRESHGDHRRVWFGNGRTDRHVIRVDNNGDRDVTIIETLEDDDGSQRIVIRTTDPSSVEVIEIDDDEIIDLHED